MDSYECIQLIKSNFGQDAIRKDEPDSFVAYEEVFRWSLMATKLKITSFVKHMPAVDLSEAKTYSEHCMKQVLSEREGLVFQTALVSFNVVVSENISAEAIRFVSSVPKKHFAAFEVPVLIDTKTMKTHFFEGSMVWGAIYESFIREYLLDHFVVS